MRVLLVYFFVGLVCVDGYKQALSYCGDICGACGARGELAEDVCICRVEKKDWNSDCLRVAKIRAEAFDMGWRVEEVDRLRDIVNSEDDLMDLQRPFRSVNNNLGLYGASGFGQARFGDYRSGIPTKGAMYEIVIGNENEDTVQLVFPQSDNIEVQHQYIFEDERGMNHPCSHIISDMDLDFELTPAENSWENNPFSFEKPRKKFHDYSDEEHNYPIYNGKNQGNLPATRVEINDEWHTSSREHHSSSFELGRPHSNQEPRKYNSNESADDYDYDNNFSYEG